MSFSKPQGKTGWQRGQCTSTANHPGDVKAGPQCTSARLPRRGPASPLPKTSEPTLWGLSSSSICEMTAGGIKGLNAGSLELDAGCSFTLIDCGGRGPTRVSQSWWAAGPVTAGRNPPPMAGPTQHLAHTG